METKNILPVITPSQEELILSQKHETYEQKLLILNMAYGKHVMPTNSFTFTSDANIKQFIDAVLGGKWEVDNGLRLINITEHIGLANFLYCKRDENGKLILEGKESDFDTVSFERATRFTIEELEVAIPDFYTHPSMVLTEKEAKDRWGFEAEEDTSDFEVSIVNTSSSKKQSDNISPNNEVKDKPTDYIQDSLKIIAKTEQKFKDASENKPNQGQKDDKKVKASLKPR
ncbi:hypothetical protein [Streptococcus suis]|uniref:hypothetical protein n=1 Tax=Streptococcus suis TaxID=1307 RepID=UPI0038B7D736